MSFSRPRIVECLPRVVGCRPRVVECRSRVAECLPRVAECRPRVAKGRSPAHANSFTRSLIQIHSLIQIQRGGHGRRATGVTRPVVWRTAMGCQTNRNAKPRGMPQCVKPCRLTYQLFCSFYVCSYSWVVCGPCLVCLTMTLRGFGWPRW